MQAVAAVGIIGPMIKTMMIAALALTLTACPSNDSKSPTLPATSAVTTLPKGDECEREDVRAFGKQCGAECRANNGGAGGGTDLAGCYAKCDAEIDRRCKL